MIDKSKSERIDNYVFLRGRIADDVQLRELPSGDTMATFRLTVDRPPGERGSVDSIECVTTRARVRSTVERADSGALLEIAGSLRRRFWRGANGVESRYSVEVVTASIKRVSQADRSAGASRSRKRASA